MKGTDNFKAVIQNHLNSLAEKDQLFSETIKKKNKSIDGCVTYILNKVKASGCAGFADEEIFGMAVHYYDEDDINPGKPVTGTVVVNHSIAKPTDKTTKVKEADKPPVLVVEKEKTVVNKTVKKQDHKIELSSLFD